MMEDSGSIQRSVTAQRRRGERHGNAKNAIIAAAEALLIQGGLSDLSLRAIAEAAGVSRQAPYNHFRDKKELLAALARTGFEELGRIIAAIRHKQSKPREQLAEAASAYIRFALERRSLFRLMFSREVVDVNDYAEARQAAEDAFDELRQIVALSAQPAQVETLTLAAWSFVHGYATLSNEHFHSGDPADDRNMANLLAELIISPVLAS